MTPMKARRVVDLVRGMPVDDALALLQFAPQAAAETVYKVLESAVANAETTEGLDRDDLVVSQAMVDEGPTMKRWRPRAQGRAYPDPQAHQPHHRSSCSPRDDRDGSRPQPNKKGRKA